jgi:hypothetical protein
MVEERPGNVVVIPGNNDQKTQYIKTCLDNGLNVLADKPMVISPEKYPELEESFGIADKKGLFVYDIEPSAYEETLQDAVRNDLAHEGLGITKMKGSTWSVDIPDRHREGHEAHFKSVMEQYLEYLKEGEIPDWKTSYMRVKYYLTTQALKMARETNQWLSIKTNFFAVAQE